MSKNRIEKDSMGEMEVPESALYGASTQRAVLNFPISNLRFSRLFIKALGIIKASACKSNLDLGLLEKDKADAITSVCQMLIEGGLDEHFVVDIFQTGSGTSSNMNANEVIANKACELLGGSLGDKSLVHPNDHVNMSQSSNDVIPTAIHLSGVLAIEEDLLPSLNVLKLSFEAKEKEFSKIVKSGRTHLQDATPIMLGQEFSGYKAQIENSINRINNSKKELLQLALGGTAVGTGLNTHPDFAKKAIAEISKITGYDFVESKNHFASQATQDSVVAFSGELKALSCAFMKIANDVRWLSSGPRCGLGELNLPEIQPGSSIMPAKVNPVICESVMMVGAQVIGNDSTISIAGQHGNFELNVMLPVIAYNLLQSIELLSNSARNFSKKCINGITANPEICESYADKSLATCTPLARVIGYDKAAKIAKEAYKQGKTVREVAKEMKVLSSEELDKVLSLDKMTKPGI